MKSFFLTAMIVMSGIISADDFVNFYGEITVNTYSFELLKKISSKSGYFKPRWDSVNTINQSYGSSLSRRGGGGSTVRKTQQRSSGQLDKTIIIVGYDLKNMADGNSIQLKKGQKLYQIGIHTNNKGFSFEVYSFTKTDKPEMFLNTSSISTRTRSTSASVYCPHCGKKLLLVPAKR